MIDVLFFRLKTETIQHLFYVVKKYLQQCGKILACLYMEGNKSVGFNVKCVLHVFGDNPKSNDSKVVIIILHTKQ